MNNAAKSAIEAAITEASAYSEGDPASDAFRRIVNLLRPALDEIAQPPADDSDREWGRHFYQFFCDVTLLLGVPGSPTTASAMTFIKDKLARQKGEVERQTKQLREEIEAAWRMIEQGFEVEPRSYFEREAPRNVFRFPLVQAVFHLWKRDPKVGGKVITELLTDAKERVSESIGVGRFMAGEQLQVSTGICESTTYGYGELDANGYWQYPVPEWLVELKRERDQLKFAVGAVAWVGLKEDEHQG